MADLLNFAIGLESSSFIGGAKKGKSALEELTSSLEESKGKLAAYQSQLNLATKLGDTAGIAKYGPLVDGARRSVFDMTQALEGMGGAGATAATGMKALAGPLGVAAAAGAVVTGVFWGIVDATTNLVTKAFEVTGANEKMLASFEALGDTRGGKNTLDLVKQLAKELPQSKNQIVEWTKELQATGVTDISQLRTEITAIASAQAIMGDAGAAAYEKLREKVSVAVEAHTPLKIASKGLTTLYKAGLNVEDIAQRMGKSTNELATGLKAGTIDAAKFGDAMRDSLLAKGKRPLEAANNSLDVLVGKVKGAWKGAWSSLFTDVDTKPLIVALQGLAALGGESGKSATLLKGGMTGALNAIIRLIGSAIVEAEVFFLRVELFALDSYIAMKPLIGAFEKVAELGKKAADFVMPGTPEGGGGGGVIPTGLERGGTIATATTIGENIGNVFGVGVLGAAGGALTSGAYELISSIGNDAAKKVAFDSGVALGKETIAGIREGTDTHSPSPLVIGIGKSISASLGMGMAASPEPARAANVVSGNALAGLGRVANTNGGSIFGGGGGVRIEHAEVHVVAPDGVTDATSVSAMGLAVALERYQIASGR